MGTLRSNTWSKVLLTLGAIGLFMTGILGWLNAAVVNGENFAGLVNEVRQDEAVKTEIGKAVAVAALDAQPDLIAVEPAIAAGAAAVAGSPILDGVFTPAIRSFHDAMTEKGSDSAVLKLADLGATATTALEKFVPQAADIIPANLNLTLAEVGGQEGIAGQIIPVIQAVSTLAWVVPLISLVLVGAGHLAGPQAAPGAGPVRLDAAGRRRLPRAGRPRAQRRGPVHGRLHAPGCRDQRGPGRLQPAAVAAVHRHGRGRWAARGLGRRPAAPGGRRRSRAHRRRPRDPSPRGHRAGRSSARWSSSPSAC